MEHSRQADTGSSNVQDDGFAETEDGEDDAWYRRFRDELMHFSGHATMSYLDTQPSAITGRDSTSPSLGIAKGNVEKKTFTWNSLSLPRFPKKGYRVSAPDGITYRDRETLVDYLDNADCKEWLQGLHDEDKKKAHELLYRSYASFVKGGAERRKRQDRDRLNRHRRPVPSEEQEISHDGTQTSTLESENTSGGDHDLAELFIPVHPVAMTTLPNFKKAIGTISDTGRRYNRHLKNLYQAYIARFTVPGEMPRKRSDRFYTTLMRRYVWAITEQYPVRLRNDPTRVEWATGYPDAPGFEEWLKNWLNTNPGGTIRVWVDDQGMHAELLSQPPGDA